MSGTRDLQKSTLHDSLFRYKNFFFSLVRFGYHPLLKLDSLVAENLHTSSAGTSFFSAATFIVSSLVSNGSISKALIALRREAIIE